MDHGLDPDPDAVPSGSRPVTDKIFRIVKCCLNVSILTGAAYPAITVKVEWQTTVHSQSSHMTLISQSNPWMQTCGETQLSVRYTQRKEERQRGGR